VFAAPTVKAAFRAAETAKPGRALFSAPRVSAAAPSPALWPDFRVGSIPVFPSGLVTGRGMSKQDSAGNEESKTAATPEPSAPVPQTNTVQPGPVASGTVPDVVTPPGEGKTTEPEMSISAADLPQGRIPVVANLGIGPLQQPEANDVSASGKHDAVSSGVSLGTFSQPGGRAVGAFGEEFYEPAFSGISWAFSGGKCAITAKLDPICPWGTNSGGDTDVPSATDPVVTATTWKAIHDDLQPASTSPFKSPRTKYYSQALVERHEKFHGTDDLGWTTSTGLGVAKTSLEAGSVTPPATPADAARVGADVTNLLNTARTKLIAENFTFYKGAGTDHDSFAGEIRAYADGKTEYQKLADAVEAQGKKLAAPPPVPAPAPGVFPPSPPPPKP